MPSIRDNGQPTLLETILRLQGDFRRDLEPIGVTPLQGGVIMFLRREVDSKLLTVAEALGVQSPTLGEVVQDLVRKGLVTKRRVPENQRAVCLRLSRQGQIIASTIDDRLRAMAIGELSNKHRRPRATSSD